MNALGPGQLKTLAAVWSIEAEGRPVNLGELARRRGVCKNAVAVNVRRLVAAGLLRSEPGKEGTLRSACRLLY